MLLLPSPRNNCWEPLLSPLVQPAAGVLSECNGTARRNNCAVHSWWKKTKGNKKIEGCKPLDMQKRMQKRSALGMGDCRTEADAKAIQRNFFYYYFFRYMLLSWRNTSFSMPQPCGTAAACPDCIPGLCHLASMKPKPARTPMPRAERVAGSCSTCAGCMARRARAGEQCNERTALNYKLLCHANSLFGGHYQFSFKCHACTLASRRICLKATSNF